MLNCRDNFVTGETSFKQDMESMRGKAEQQGTAQPGLRDAAKDIKKVRATKPYKDPLADTVLCVEMVGMLLFILGS